MSLHLVTSPTSLPLTLHQAKAHLRIEDVDNDDNALIMGYLRAAVSHIDGRDGWLGRAIMTQTWDLKLDRFPCATRHNPWGAIFVPLPPLQSVTSVTYVDTAGVSQTLATSKYTVSDSGFGAARVLPAYEESWPSTRGHVDDVTVRFVAGYTTTPEAIESALYLMIGHFYTNREAVNAGDIVTKFPMSVESLLAPYQVHGF